MSIEAVRAFERYSAARRSTFNVGHQLAWYAQQHTNLAWPTDEQLMAACRISERQLHRSLRWLEQAGEIVREVSPGHRRVYRVTLAEPATVSGFTVAEPANLAGSTCHPVRWQPATVAGQPANSASRVKGLKTKTALNTPPTPQGGSAPDLIAALHQQPPLLIAGVQPPARPRRRRDRDSVHAALLERCPGSSGGPASERWSQIAERVRERVGDETWQVWLGAAHPHRLDGETLVLALAPATLEWVHDRFGDVIAQASECQVALVGCERLGGRR